VPILRFTGRARDRLRMYHLREADVADALANPDRSLRGASARQYAFTSERQHVWRRLGEGWLKVTFVEGSRVLTVVIVEMLATGPPESEERAPGQPPSDQSPLRDPQW
jgi:hypothetical protein